MLLPFLRTPRYHPGAKSKQAPGRFTWLAPPFYRQTGEGQHNLGWKLKDQHLPVVGCPCSLNIIYVLGRLRATRGERGLLQARKVANQTEGPSSSGSGPASQIGRLDAWVRRPGRIPLSKERVALPDSHISCREAAVEDVLWRTLCHILKLHLGACPFVAANSPDGKSRPSSKSWSVRGYGLESLGEAGKGVTKGKGIDAMVISR